MNAYYLNVRGEDYCERGKYQCKTIDAETEVEAMQKALEYLAVSVVRKITDRERLALQGRERGEECVRELLNRPKYLASHEVRYHRKAPKGYGADTRVWYAEFDKALAAGGFDKSGQGVCEQWEIQCDQGDEMEDV